MKKLFRKLFPVPLSNGGIFGVLILNFMFIGPLHSSYNRLTTDQKDVRSFYVEGVLKRYNKGHQTIPSSLTIASGDKTFTIVVSDKYHRHIRKEIKQYLKQYLGEVFMIKYIKGPKAKKKPYSITLKDGRQILNVDREEYIDWVWTARRIHHITILTVSAFMLASLIQIVLTVLSRLRNRGESP